MNDLMWTVIIGTSVLLGLIAFVVLLVVLNNARRIRHRAELAEAERLRKDQVATAERETTRHILREIGRELHDNAGQLLAVAQLGVNTELDEHGPNARLVAARDALEQGLEEVRRVGHHLNTDLWQHRSLADAISAEAERLERTGRLRVELLVKQPLPFLPPDTSTVLFRIFQLAVTNAVKHSGSPVIHIGLEPAGSGLRLVVRDEGRGFNARGANPGAGIHTIHQRCTLISYAATCDSSPGTGCTWTIQPDDTDHGT
ncbi:MAG: histidine kinase [Flavobacteriales bacterium]|jgi:signal transduction histidine kinase|nr:histidine kinase [Flavobacteriales bacterium]